MKNFFAQDWQRRSKAFFPYSGSCHMNMEQTWRRWTEKEREEFNDSGTVMIQLIRHMDYRFRFVSIFLKHDTM